jgi:hypothetical protein
MALEHVKETLKKHWPLIAAGIAGVYILYTYMGSSSSASSSDDSDAATLAAQQAAAAQTAATNTANDQAYALQSQQISAAATAQGQANEVSQTQAVGSAVGDIGSAISSVIQSQSIIPAEAINAAGTSNQEALIGAASVAAEGIQSIPGAIQAATNSITASYTPLAILGQSLIGLNNNIGGLGTAAVNAVGQSVSSSAGSAASSAAASAQANAAATSSIANATSKTAVAMA